VSVFGVFGHGLLIVGLVLALILVSAAFQNAGISVAGTVCFALLALLPAALAVYGGFKVVECRRMAESIIYVPPVRDQIAALPQHAILLRGSEQPTATADELLRATKEPNETPSEQLLRASAMPTSRQK